MLQLCQHLICKYLSKNIIIVSTVRAHAKRRNLKPSHWNRTLFRLARRLASFRRLPFALWRAANVQIVPLYTTKRLSFLMDLQCWTLTRWCAAIYVTLLWVNRIHFHFNYSRAECYWKFESWLSVWSAVILLRGRRRRTMPKSKMEVFIIDWKLSLL